MHGFMNVKAFRKYLLRIGHPSYYELTDTPMTRKMEIMHLFEAFALLGC